MDPVKIESTVWHVVKLCFNGAKPKLRPDETLQLLIYDRQEMLLKYPDQYIVGLEYWREDQYKSIIRESYTVRRVPVSVVEVDAALRSKNSNKIIHLFNEAIRYLILMIRPTRPSPKFRILRRRLVLSPSPKFRSRLRR